MKNFSELLATDQTITIEISIDGRYECHINGKPTQTLSIGLRDSILIEIRSLPGESAEIKSLLLDDFEIVPGWTHLANFTNDEGRVGPTTYLDNNGIWTLSIMEPFYQWKHQVTGQGWLFYQNTK